MTDAGDSTPAAAVELCIEFTSATGERVAFETESAHAEYRFGRAKTSGVRDNKVLVYDRTMSGTHCRLFRSGPHWNVEDLGSSNGSKLNNAALQKNVVVQLTIPCELRLGQTKVLLSTPSQAAQAPADQPLNAPELNNAELFDGEKTQGVDDNAAEAVTYVEQRPATSQTQQSAASNSDSTDAPIPRPTLEQQAAPSLSLHDDSTIAAKTIAPGQMPAKEPPAAPSLSLHDDSTIAAKTIAPGQMPAKETPAAPGLSFHDNSTIASKTGIRARVPPATSPRQEPDATMAAAPAYDPDATMAAAPGNDPDATIAAAPGSDPNATMAAAPRRGANATRAATTRHDPNATVAPALRQDPNATVDPNDFASGKSTVLGPAAAASPREPVANTLDLHALSLNSPIISALIEKQFATPAQIHGALADAQSSGRTFFRSFIESGAARARLDDLYAEVAQLQGLELLDDTDDLYQRASAPDWLTIGQARRLGVIALSDEARNEFHFATVDPFDLPTSDWLSRRSGADTVVQYLAHPNAHEAAIGRLATRQESSEDLHSVIDISEEQEEDIRAHLSEADAPQIVDYFLHRASLQGASDIHIEPTEKLMVVRVRIDGVLQQDISLPMPYHSAVSSRLKIISGMDVAEKRRPQDGRIGVVIRGNPIDVRVSTFPTVHGEKIVMRLLDKNALRPSPDSLGLLPRDLRVLKDKINAPYGLVMLCGPTGSGKTTTLYSCLGAIDTVRKNVLTVEDPVEYRMNGVHQMQVNERIGLDFASGLRTILRQDPDVIMVGECRDKPTSAMAIQASLTGHVVFSTIHTNDAVGVVTRMIDLGIEPFLVASSLTLAIAQRLVRVLCPSCKISVEGEKVLENLLREGVSREKLEQLGIEIDPYTSYSEARGCVHCRDMGYNGRIAVFEVFEMTAEARSVIASPGFQESDLRALAARSGMTTLVRHGMTLIDTEVTTLSEIVRVLGESN